MIATQPHIDWRGYAGFRDILVHQYHKTEMEIVWTMVQDDLPPLKAAIEAILASLDESGSSH